jgi:polyisoprenoid-binding protein YceI
MMTTLLSFFFFIQAQDATTCSYQYKPDSLKIEWTAYKFTEKKGVKGSFPAFKLNAPETAASAKELFEKTSVEIDPFGLDSGDPGRDENLKKSFFKKMVGSKIKGTVVAFDPAISKIKIEMNGKSKVVPFRMKIEGGKYLGETDIDILDFKMQKSLESINKACYDLHKGPDGKSKTWSQVSLALSAEVIENCPNKK